MIRTQRREGRVERGEGRAERGLTYFILTYVSEGVYRENKETGIY